MRHSGKTALAVDETPDNARPKRAELLVAAIEGRIEQEQLQPGTPLGTEAQLMAQHQISRETLRNAIRQLERHGVAAMRRGGGGGGGGLIVAAPASETAVRAITAHLELSDIGWSEIVEARGLIDAQAAVLASRRIDARGTARLRQLIAELDGGPSTVRDTARRHLALPDAVAGICGNPVVLLFSRAPPDSRPAPGRRGAGSAWRKRSC
ncbi:MAG: FadR/GntR family transcriptional regulator, partial [Solimonas sp.]